MVVETLLKPIEAARYLRLSLGALYAATERGEIPAIRLGQRRLRYSLQELHLLVQAGKVSTVRASVSQVAHGGPA